MQDFHKSSMADNDTLPFFYLLDDDNFTARLIGEEPPWGRDLAGVAPEGRFQMTPWQILQHVLVFRLARHRYRTSSAAQASACVVASPIERGNGGSLCADDAIVRHLIELGARRCPGKPIVVVDGPDADGTKDALCNALWSPAACARAISDPLVRVSGNAPGLQSEVATRLRRGYCRRSAPIPYLAHARSAAAAASALGTRHGQLSGEVSGLPARPLRIAYAAASWGHVDAERHGFVAWRKALRNACKALHSTNAYSCSWVWISMSGQGAEKALQAYSTATFCLQPPGDTLPRPGIVDALSSGCIPVIFHPSQATLWPAHWQADRGPSPSAVVFDWTLGAGPRPRLRDRDHGKYAERARADLQALVEMPAQQVEALRRGVAAAAPRVIYRGAAPEPSTSPVADEDDAVDVLVRSLRPLRLVASAEEEAAYREQLRQRRRLIRAQGAYEEARRAAGQASSPSAGRRRRGSQRRQRVAP